MMALVPSLTQRLNVRVGRDTYMVGVVVVLMGEEERRRKSRRERNL